MAATTVTIGVLYLTGAQAAGAAFGIPGFTTGDGRAEGQALVNYVNAHGGLAGHRVLPLFYAEDLTKANSDPSTSDQAICAYFTQDHHVYAVVAGGLGTSENLTSCLRKAGVTVISNYTASAVDAPYARKIQGFFYAPSDFQAERMYRTYITGLVAEGFLTRSSKVGVYYDTSQPSSQRILEGTVKPLLARYGVPLAATAGASGAAGADWQSAGLRFKAAGVDRVLGVFWSPLFFMQAAESQQYHPRYGLMSLWAPGALVQTAAPKDQLTGSVGVGWQPYSDVDAGHNPGPVSDNETLCKKIMTDAGQSSTSATTALSQLQTCDAVFFLHRALSGTRTITPVQMAAQVAMLADSYRSAVTFRSRFADGRSDGAAAYRISRYTDSCSCFTYTGAVHAV